jgi:hypothetical protein
MGMSIKHNLPNNPASFGFSDIDSKKSQSSDGLLSTFESVKVLVDAVSNFSSSYKSETEEQQQGQESLNNVANLVSSFLKDPKNPAQDDHLRELTSSLKLMPDLLEVALGVSSEKLTSEAEPKNDLSSGSGVQSGELTSTESQSFSFDAGMQNVQLIILKSMMDMMAVVNKAMESLANNNQALNDMMMKLSSVSSLMGSIQSAVTKAGAGGSSDSAKKTLAGDTDEIVKRMNESDGVDSPVIPKAGASDGNKEGFFKLTHEMVQKIIDAYSKANPGTDGWIIKALKTKLDDFVDGKSHCMYVGGIHKNDVEDRNNGNGDEIYGDKGLGYWSSGSGAMVTINDVADFMNSSFFDGGKKTVNESSHSLCMNNDQVFKNAVSIDELKNLFPVPQKIIITHQMVTMLVAKIKELNPNATQSGLDGYKKALDDFVEGKAKLNSGNRDYGDISGNNMGEIDAANLATWMDGCVYDKKPSVEDITNIIGTIMPRDPAFDKDKNYIQIPDDLGGFADGIGGSITSGGKQYIDLSKLKNLFDAVSTKLSSVIGGDAANSFTNICNSIFSQTASGFSQLLQGVENIKKQLETEQSKNVNRISQFQNVLKALQDAIDKGNRDNHIV